MSQDKNLQSDKPQRRQSRHDGGDRNAVPQHLLKANRSWSTSKAKQNQQAGIKATGRNTDRQAKHPGPFALQHMVAVKQIIAAAAIDFFHVQGGPGEVGRDPQPCGAKAPQYPYHSTRKVHGHAFCADELHKTALAVFDPDLPGGSGSSPGSYWAPQPAADAPRCRLNSE